MTSMSQLENNTIIITVITLWCKVEVERIKKTGYIDRMMLVVHKAMVKNNNNSGY